MRVNILHIYRLFIRFSTTPRASYMTRCVIINTAPKTARTHELCVTGTWDRDRDPDEAGWICSTLIRNDHFTNTECDTREMYPGSTRCVCHLCGCGKCFHDYFADAQLQKKYPVTYIYFILLALDICGAHLWSGNKNISLHL